MRVCLAHTAAGRAVLSISPSPSPAEMKTGSGGDTVDHVVDEDEGVTIIKIASVSLSYRFFITSTPY